MWYFGCSSGIVVYAAYTSLGFGLFDLIDYLFSSLITSEPVNYLGNSLGGS